MAANRTEEEILVKAGLPVVLGGETRYVPPLTIEANRAWKTTLNERIAARWGDVGQITGWEQVGMLLAGADDELLILLLAYDTTNALGGREYVESHATPADLYAAFKVVFEAAFPFVRDARAFPALIKLLLEQVQASSTSGSSTSGAGSPKKSTKP